MPRITAWSTSQVSTLAAMRGRLAPSALGEWPVPFDPRWELDWSRPDYSRRLLREHLDQSHDGATRRTGVVDEQVRRLRRLLPEPPSRVLDAACGPGLYAVRLAAAGYDVTGVDVGPAALRHARSLARARAVRGRVRFQHGDLRTLEPPKRPYDAAIVIYYVLEAFQRADQRERAGDRPPGTMTSEAYFPVTNPSRTEPRREAASTVGAWPDRGFGVCAVGGVGAAGAHARRRAPPEASAADPSRRARSQGQAHGERTADPRDQRMGRDPR